MTETRKDIEGKNTSPFQEEIDLENYFVGANRNEVLSRMQAALQNGVALVVLTGEEGSGKTMMCRMLEHVAPGSCITVFFPRTVDSFEDVVRLVATRLGVEISSAVDRKSAEGVLVQITESLQRNSKDLLVIFDEAENIYLATLERIRKMQDRITGLGSRMHILFSGRTTFLENCDQLSICDFDNSDELYLDLTPLSEIETGEYLRTCSERFEDLDSEKGVFDDEVVEGIYSIAKGNFRMTNVLAEEAMGSDGAESPVQMAFDSVTADEKTQTEESDKPTLPDLLSRYSDYLPWIGGGLCFLVLLLFFFGPGKEKDEHGSKDGQTEIITTQVAGSEEKLIKPEPTTIETPPQEVTDQVDSKIVASPQQKEIPLEEKEVAEKIEIAEPDQPPVKEKPLELEVPVKKVQVPKAVPKVVAKEKVEKTPTESKKLVKKQPPVEKTIIELSPTRMMKRKPGSLPPPAPAPVRGKITLQPPRTEVQEVVESNAHFTVEQLLRKRSLAGAQWARGGKNNMYTVQLMVLASKTAEKNLLTMLAKDNYRQEAGNFYIFQREAKPQNIFVFYGEYPTIAMARLAQNSLPQFLRNHKPYALSIKGAVAKVK